MTTKELIYIEDALGHEQYFTTQCNEIASKITDPDLRSYVESMAKKHQTLFDRFLSLL